MLIFVIILTPIAAIFHKIAAAIAVLQFDIINWRDAAVSTAHHLRSRRFRTHLHEFHLSMNNIATAVYSIKIIIIPSLTTSTGDGTAAHNELVVVPMRCCWFVFALQ
jgi:hypothetical protein